MMPRVTNPILFSKQFGIDRAVIEKAGFIDPILNCDTPLFIDPLLLHGDTDFAGALAALRERFTNILKLVSYSKQAEDAPWRGARELLDISECRENCLGYGGTGTGGSSRSRELRDRILKTAKEIMEIGVDNPELISLMGFLEGDVGADTISDLTSHAILGSLAERTTEFCEKIGVPLTDVTDERGKQKFRLPLNPFVTRRKTGVVLVPTAVLRELPIAADLSEVSDVAFQNQALRDQINAFITDLAKATTREKKAALRQAAMSSAKNFLDLMNDLIASNASYDVRADLDGHFGFRDALSRVAAEYPLKLNQGPQNAAYLSSIVAAIMAHFKKLIEDNDIGDLLWTENNQPRNEKAAQLLFFAVAQAYCTANNLDVSPECDMGGGPVDFKFSQGSAFRHLVEIKLSTGRVVHGYKKQLAVYATAAATDNAILLIIDVGKMGRKLKTIQKHRELEVAMGRKAPEIVVVDATKKASASVRE
jgi:hypothetical protein